MQLRESRLPARTDRTARTPDADLASSAPTAVQLKQALRGMDYSDQVAALAPPSDWAADAVQMRSVQRAEDPAAVHRAAAHGIAGGGASVPHFGAIQRAFGHHDVSGIQAHTGAEATEASQAMGAEAYATGNHVVFGSAPDMHTAAHEAAHVVQQQAGVSLAGGVGASGDAYEQHADQVADAVVRGEPADGLLDQMTGKSGGASVQKRSVQRREATTPHPEAATDPAATAPETKAAPAATQPGPHSLAVGGAGSWLVEVTGRSAGFDQRLRVTGAKGAFDTENAPPVGQPVQVQADGPWSLAVEHRVRPDQASWAKGKPVGQWLGSTHRAEAQGKDFFDFATEDFRDGDFNDLSVSGCRSDSLEDDGAYLVSSETSVEGATTRYDLIVGASASGRLDVVLDLVTIGPEALSGGDPAMLTALGERLAIVRGMVQSSPEVAANREPLLATLGAWEASVRAALHRAAATPHAAPVAATGPTV